MSKVIKDLWVLPGLLVVPALWVILDPLDRRDWQDLLAVLDLLESQVRLALLVLEGTLEFLELSVSIWLCVVFD